MIDTIINSCTNSNASLGIDQACFSILNLYINPVIFYAIAWEAYTGTGVPLATLKPNSNTSLIIKHKNTHYTYIIKLLNHIKIMNIVTQLTPLRNMVVMDGIYHMMIYVLIFMYYMNQEIATFQF